MKQKFYHQKQFRLLTKRTLLLLLSFIFMSAIYAQEKTVTGTIVDKSGVPLPGVNVVIKGTTNGTVTDLDGKYSIKVPDNNTVLSITYVGYTSQELLVGEQTKIAITLSENVKEIDQVVVVGYGVQKKSNLSGAIASVSGESLSKLPSAGIDEALQGKAAGVNVIQNSGMPGGSVTIQIRGLSSINGYKPLVIVDGVPGDLTHLNPDDVESIEVLKDASSAAIYGASGGNGVILVTTKHGNEGETKTTVNYYRGVQSPWKQIELLNSQQYVTVMNRINMLSNPTAYKPYSTKPDTFKNYNWQDIMFRPAIMENLDFSVSGGNKRSTFLLSGSYLNQEGILRKSDYQRYILRINSDHQLDKWLKIGENASYTQSITQGLEESEYQNEYLSPIPNILSMLPFVPAYDKNGKWAPTPDNLGSPKIAEDELDKTISDYNTSATGYVEITPVKGFIYTSRISGSMDFNVYDRFNPQYFYSPLVANNVSSVEKRITQYYNWTWQNFANYNITFLNDHNLGLMAGMEAYSDVTKDISGTRNALASSAPEDQYFNASQDITSTGPQLVAGGGNHNRNMAYFGRLNYDYKNTFLLTSNFRQDYSSEFGPNKKYGDFPSLSLGFKFSEYLKNLSFLSFGKARFSWGKTGANAPEGFRYSSNVVSNLTALTYIFDGSNKASQGAAAVKLSNPDLGWESMDMTDYGVDLAFLKNKFTLTVDYFDKHNNGMIYPKSVLSSSGTYEYSGDVYQLGGDARPLVNIGSVDNKGWEFSVGYKKMEGELKASFDFNIAFIKNKVLDVAGDTTYTGSVGVNLSNIVVLEKGVPIGAYYGFKTQGIFRESDARTKLVNGKVVTYIWNQPYTIKTNGDTAYAQPFAKPGDIKYVDLNHDGVINSKDRTVLGSPTPTFSYGFSGTLEYKGFELDFSFQGTYGNKIFNGAKEALMAQGPGRNRSIDVLNQYYSPIYDGSGNLLDPGNTTSSLPRLSVPSDANQNFTRISDYFVEDGSYLRLKNIQLGYTVPKFISDKIKVESLEVYIGAKNLFTITKYTGYDPEISSSDALTQGIDKAGNYPQPRMFLFGAKLRF
jgi:TonB-dependent starch-binding outer membrane protein SusC